MSEAGHGSIVLFSSIYGSFSPDPAIYEASMNKNPIKYGVGKPGIIQMIRYMAVHWGKNNVRCNCISPEPLPNKKVQQESPEFVDRLAKNSPMGRIGRPPEIAGTVAFYFPKLLNILLAKIYVMTEGGLFGKCRNGEVQLKAVMPFLTICCVT